MPERVRWSAVAAALVLLAPYAAHAGAWVREPGHFFVKAGAVFSAASDPQNELIGLTQRAMLFSLYAEVGLPYQFDVVAELPYVVSSNTFRGDAQYDNHSLGDAHVQIERSILSQLALTGAVDLKVPMYRTLSSTVTTGLVQVNDKFYPAGSFPEVGNGDVELTPKLLYGKSFYPRPAWLTAELAVPIHFKGPLHGIYATGYVALGAGVWVWPDHLAFAVFSRLSSNFQRARTQQYQEIVTASGQDAAYALYLAGTVIVSGAPWLPWLKLFGSAGAMLLNADKRQGTDFAVGLAVER